MFAIMVCAEIRKRFGAPIESLRWVRECMTQKGADHFAAAVRIMATLRLPVLLLTDLKETFIMDHPFEMSDLFEYGMFSAEGSDAFVLVKVNPLVNRILACLKEPVQFTDETSGYRLFHEVRNMNRAKHRSEVELLEMVRDETAKRVEAQLKDGRIQTLFKELDLDPTKMTGKEIIKAVKGHAHQTVSFKNRGGKIVNVKQTISRKPNA